MASRTADVVRACTGKILYLLHEEDNADVEQHCRRSLYALIEDLREMGSEDEGGGAA